MTLANTVLAKLGERRTQGRNYVTAQDAGWTATITTERTDSVGCLVWEVQVQRHSTGRAPDSLSAWAEHVARQTTGLVEPLKVLEVDSLRQEALLRSQGPSARAGELYYYEVLLHGTQAASVRRYRGRHDPAHKREQVPFALTYEVLGNLLTTLTGV